MISFVWPTNIIDLITTVVAWCAIIALCMYLYKKSDQKPKVWKVILVILISLFSFSVSFNPGFKLPVLPLGVWLLYWYFHRKMERWQVYRKFAWLGFGANFIFLTFSLIQNPLHHAIYPQNLLSTYISNTENVSITAIHSSGTSTSIDKSLLHKQVPAAKRKPIDAMKWYNQIVMSKLDDERFPYIIDGTKPKWGSGIKSVVYLEKDGKGLLVTTSGKQLYFYLKNSIIKGNN